MSIRTRLFSGFILVIIIFLVSFFVNQRLSQDVIRNTEYINRSEVVIRNSNEVQKFMIDMQSGYRGYLLTGQKEFLNAFDEGLESVPALMKTLDEVTVVEEQRERLDSISRIHKRWVDYARSLISIKSDTLPAATLKYGELFEKKVKTGTGKKLNDQIRDVFLAFDSYEYQLRYDRRLKLEASLRTTGRINVALTIFTICIALLSAFYIVRIITKRISKMVLQAEEISRGNFVMRNDDKNDELTRLSHALNTMSTILNKNFMELKEKNRELDQFAYVVSHDLKAPLRGIDNITNWIEEDHAHELSPLVKKNLELIKGRTQRLDNMINGLLDYARIGKAKIEREKLVVGDMLKEIIELLVPSNFMVSIGSNMPVIYTIKVQLMQVFSNLISNAVKYNDKTEGRIEIGCVSRGEFFEFSVSDNGIGIQSIYFEKIFAIFQTLKERDAFESTGVGLAIVKRIVESHQGKIWLESIPGKGSTFYFTWPAKDLQSEKKYKGR